MSHVKLQFKVKLKNDTIIGSQNALELYHLIITFLDKDEFFESNFKENKIIIYNGKNGFRIKSVWDEPFGDISDSGLTIPNLDKIGFELKKTFTTENDRYLFLKKVYNTVLEWSNEWEGFKYDSESIIEFDNDIWTISCERHNVRTKRNHSHISKELIRRNMLC